jgi:cyanuric acid amidohydrolase
LYEARAYTVPMKSPDDISAIAGLFDSGDVDPGHVCAIIAQTEGDGFARGYFTLAFETLMAARLKVTPERVRETIPVLAIGGTAGLMTPHATLFVRQPAPEAPPVHERALALGVAFTRTLEAEEIGSVSQVMLVAEAVGLALADAGITDPDDVAAVEIKCPQPAPASCPHSVMSS